MDINTTSLFAQQQGLGQLNVAQAALKASAKSEQQTATILANAIEGVASAGNGRGTNLDITV